METKSLGIGNYEICGHIRDWNTLIPRSLQVCKYCVSPSGSGKSNIVINTSFHPATRDYMSNCIIRQVRIDIFLLKHNTQYLQDQSGMCTFSTPFRMNKYILESVTRWRVRYVRSAVFFSPIDINISSTISGNGDIIKTPALQHDNSAGLNVCA